VVGSRLYHRMPSAGTSRATEQVSQRCQAYSQNQASLRDENSTMQLASRSTTHKSTPMARWSMLVLEKNGSLTNKVCDLLKRDLMYYRPLVNMRMKVALPASAQARYRKKKKWAENDPVRRCLDRFLRPPSAKRGNQQPMRRMMSVVQCIRIPDVSP